jgi:hypothetical protein
VFSPKVIIIRVFTLGLYNQNDICISEFGHTASELTVHVMADRDHRKMPHVYASGLHFRDSHDIKSAETRSMVTNINME